MTATTLLAVDAAAAAVFLLLAGRGVRNRDRPGAVAATLLWCVLAGIAGAIAFGRVELLPARTALRAVLVGWILAVPLWAGFAFEHTGRGPAPDRRWTALAVAYVTVTGVTSVRGAAVAGAVGQAVRVGTSILQTGLIGVGLFGVFLLVRSTVTYDDISRRRGAALSVGGVATSLLLFSVSTVDAAGSVTLPWASTGFLALGAASFAAGALPGRPFGGSPGAGPLARASVLEAMSEAVVVVDRADRLVDANAAAERSLGVVVARDAGRRLDAVLGWDPETLLESAGPVSTPTGRRQFDATRSPLTNRAGERVGTAFVFQDVTDRRTREQRLEVFNRVLRHNLRNDLDAIRAFAESLADEAVDEPAAVATRIRDTASELVEVGTTVERGERVMTRDALDYRTVDLGALAADVARSVRERQDCEIEMSAGDGPRLTTDRGVLRTALAEVIENAAEHANGEAPTVRIELDPTDGGARVAVRDRGPGIPERERAVLVDGEETPLRHGTGVGLWFVSWAVTRLGGTLSFEAAEPGSRVVLEIPDRGGVDPDDPL